MANELIAGFTYPEIEKIQGRPDFKSIRSLHEKLNENAGSVDCNFGGGRHGWLGLTISPVMYLQLTGHQFIPPVNPGIVPNIPANATRNEAAIITNDFNAFKKQFTEMKQMDTALKNQIISFVEDIYLSPLKIDTLDTPM